MTISTILKHTPILQPTADGSLLLKRAVITVALTTLVDLALYLRKDIDLKTLAKYSIPYAAAVIVLDCAVGFATRFIRVDFTGSFSSSKETDRSPSEPQLPNGPTPEDTPTTNKAPSSSSKKGQGTSARAASSSSTPSNEGTATGSSQTPAQDGKNSSSSTQDETSSSLSSSSSNAASSSSTPSNEDTVTGSSQTPAQDEKSSSSSTSSSSAAPSSSTPSNQGTATDPSKTPAQDETSSSLSSSSSNAAPSSSTPSNEDTAMDPSKTPAQDGKSSSSSTSSSSAAASSSTNSLQSQAPKIWSFLIDENREDDDALIDNLLTLSSHELETFGPFIEGNWLKLSEQTRTQLMDTLTAVPLLATFLRFLGDRQALLFDFYTDFILCGGDSPERMILALEKEVPLSRKNLEALRIANSSPLIQKNNLFRNDPSNGSTSSVNSVTPADPKNLSFLTDEDQISFTEEDEDEDEDNTSYMVFNEQLSALSSSERKHFSRVTDGDWIAFPPSTRRMLARTTSALPLLKVFLSSLKDNQQLRLDFYFDFISYGNKTLPTMITALEKESPLSNDDVEILIHQILKEKNEGDTVPKPKKQTACHNLFFLFRKTQDKPFVHRSQLTHTQANQYFESLNTPSTSKGWKSFVRTCMFPVQGTPNTPKILSSRILSSRSTTPSSKTVVRQLQPV